MTYPQPPPNNIDDRYLWAIISLIVGIVAMFILFY